VTVSLLLLCLVVLPWLGADLLARRAGAPVTVATVDSAPAAPAQHRHTPPDPESWWYEQPARQGDRPAALS